MKVLNRKHDPIPSGAVYIGRPSQFGNPFRIGPDGDRAAVLGKFREWFKRKLGESEFRNALEELRGASALVCWCAPEGCHGDIIAEYLEDGE